MRSKKVEAAIKKSESQFIAIVGTDFTERPINEFTNAGATKFCPFIDNEKLAQVILKARGVNTAHRDYPTSFNNNDDWEKNNKNKQNSHYHWAQIGFKSVQFCQLQEEPVDRNNDLCEKHFKKCLQYQLKMTEDF